MLAAPTTRDLATALGIDLWTVSTAPAVFLMIGAEPCTTALREGSVVISAVHSHLTGLG